MRGLWLMLDCSAKGGNFADSNIHAQSTDVNPHALGNLLSSKVLNVNKN
jgi:hypothetical protein